MPKHPIIWVAVADGARARILATTDRHAFTVVDALSSHRARVRPRYLGSDRPGRSHESAASAHHAIAARHDPHELAKEAFLQTVADRLRQGAEGKRYEKLILVAPKRQLGWLRDNLEPCVREKITAEHGKDLTRLPIAQLGEHLTAMLGPQ